MTAPRVITPELIRNLYEDPSSLDRREFQTIYAIQFGFPQIPSLLKILEAITAGIWQSQNMLFETGYKKDLGWNDIGFESIQIQCRAEVAHEANIYIQGFYDEILLLHKYKELCRIGSSCIDVGANVGIHSIAMAKCIGPTGRVFAVEPRTELVQQIHHNLIHNKTHNIEIFPFAAYKENTMVAFNTNSNNFNQGVGVIADKNANTVVPAKKLDLCFARAADPLDISLIKIDVEGNEMDVLEGAVKILKKHKPKVIVEHATPPWSIKDLIKHFPYPVKITRIRNTQYDAEFEVVEDTILQGWNNLLVEPR